MQFKDYYKVLGVPRDATAESIKKAFRRLARKYHPDVSREKDAATRMVEVNEAYAVLSDPQRRAAYDQLGERYQSGQEFHAPPDWDAGFEFSGHGFSPHESADFSDFFEQLFGRAGMGGRGGFRDGRQPFRAQGEDHHAKVLLDLEDAFTGAVRQIALRVPKLDERGRVTLKARTLNVKIPKGVREGQIIRLAGQGGSRVGDIGAPGDLLLEVHFKPHPRFRADARNLIMTLPVAPWEAALGAIIHVALPHGEIKVRIPPGVQSGRQLRVRAKGIPGEPAGDLLLDIRVMVPPADTQRARELYETMAKEFAFDPRAVNTPEGR